MVNGQQIGEGVSNFIIAYPETGLRANIVEGVSTFDFWEGEFFDADGTKTTLKRKLKNSRQDFIRSLVIFHTQGLKVRLGSQSEPLQIFSDECNWNVFENIAIRDLEIETTASETPEGMDILVIASTSRKAIYKPIPVKIHQDAIVSSQSTTDAYATLFQRHTLPFNHNTFIIEETGTTNGITYKIEAKLTHDGNWVEIQSDTTVAASGNDVVQIEGAFHLIRVQIKATVGGSQGTVQGQWLGQG